MYPQRCFGLARAVPGFHHAQRSDEECFISTKMTGYCNVRYDEENHSQHILRCTFSGVVYSYVPISHFPPPPPASPRFQS